MLLRNDRDQDIYLNMASPTHQQDQEEQPTYHAGHEADTMDDVWGSDDDSTTATQSHPHQTTSYFASQPHVSDVPRLKKEHTTAGYRDGVTQAKAASVQSGFDEGFGLGATIGAHAGRLLGVLTGLSSAISSSSQTTTALPDDDENKRLHDLLESATSELSVQSIFSPTYWESDGTWKYDIVTPAHPNPSAASSRRRALTMDASQEALERPVEGGDEAVVVEEDEEEPLVFADIAAAHPLLKKWDGILQREAERYDLVWDVLLPELEEAHDQRADAQQREDDDDAGRLAEGGKKAVVIENKGALSW